MSNLYNKCKSLRVDDMRKDFRGYTKRMMLEAFGIYGPIQSIRMCNDHCFINFEKRSYAESALNALTGSPRPLYGASLSWALYPFDSFRYPSFKTLRIGHDNERFGAGIVGAVRQENNTAISKEKIGTLVMSTSGTWFTARADIDTKSMAKVLYVRNLSKDFKKDVLKKVFEVYGPIKDVDKMKYSAMVLFEKRIDALQALSDLNGRIWKGKKLAICLGHPRSDDDLDLEIPQLLRDDVGDDLVPEVPHVLPETPPGGSRNVGSGERGLDQRERWKRGPVN